MKLYNLASASQTVSFSVLRMQGDGKCLNFLLMAEVDQFRKFPRRRRKIAIAVGTL